MNYINISETTLETLIEGLQDAVNVCYNADGSSEYCEKSYPYAVGYSRGVMETIIDQLKYIKSQTN